MPWKKCRAEVNISSDMVSRLYSEGAFDPEAREQVFKFVFQELFYEWTLAFTLSEPVHKLSFELHHLQEDDRASLKPATVGQVSEPIKWWYSGFSEPKRNRPDYFMRTVVLPEVPVGTSVTLIVRRALGRPVLSANDLITIENLYASDCQIGPTFAPGAQDAEHLQRRAVGLANNVRPNGESTGLPIKLDPGDPGNHEMQGTLEMRCKDDVCANMVAQQMAVRLGKSPEELMKEQQLERLSALRKELNTIVPCSEIPQANLDSGQASLSVPLCGGPVKLTAENIERVTAVFQKYGITLNMGTPPP
jgi:hypothetical protein